MAKNPKQFTLATDAYTTLTVGTVCKTVTVYEDGEGKTTGSLEDRSCFRGNRSG